MNVEIVEKSLFEIAVLIPLIIVAVIFIICHTPTKKEKTEKSEVFDERQIAVRGKAYRSGFYALIISELVILAIQYLFTIPFSPLELQFTAIIIGFDAFILTVIHYDAYLGLSDNARKTTVGIIITSVLFVLNAVINTIGCLRNGYIPNLVLICGAISFVIISAALIIHNAKREEDDE